MRNSRSTVDPPFRLCQETVSTPRKPFRQAGGSALVARPTGQGDYALEGRDTYPIKDRIHAAGGRWDSRARKWFVTRDQARELSAAILVRVLRGPACCEKQMGIPERGVADLASMEETLVGRMTVRLCSHCDSHIREIVGIRDVLDVDELPELPPSEREPWED